MRPKAKTVPWIREGADLAVAVNPTAADLVRFNDPDRVLERILDGADGTRTVGELADAIGVPDPGPALTTLDEAGLMIDADPLAAVPELERSRWRNNLGFLESFANLDRGPVVYHRRLREATVLMLGVGGLGSAVLMNLVGFGVGEVILVDFDTVEPANLNRQFVYRTSDVGQSKVNRAADWVREFSGETTVRTVVDRIGSVADVSALLAGVDLVIAAIDQPDDAPNWINEACVAAGLPCVYGGFSFSKGQYNSVWPGHSACLACLLMGEVFRLRPINRATGPSVGIVGGLMALEAVRYLTGFAEPAAAARTWMVDFATGEVSAIGRWGRSSRCPVCGDDDAGNEGDAELTLGSRIDVGHLTVVPDGDDFLIGDIGEGTFIAVPEVGAVVIEALRRGGTVAEATTEASDFAGTDVNVLEFVEVLRDRGMIRFSAGPAVAAEPAADGQSRRSLRLLGARFVDGVARAMFSRVAWVLYGVATLAGGAILLAEPGLRPDWESIIFLPDPAFALFISVLTAVAMGAIHEGFHWFAARRQGLPARLRVSRRGLFVVFETDLTRLWSVPRQRRYGAFLAGMAFDGLMLGGCLLARLAHQRGWITLPETLDRYLAVVILAAVVALLSQVPLFMRTDLYAVLVAALGCRNLYRVSMLILKGRLLGLSALEQTELDAASARDRSVGRWFSLLYLVGVLGLTYLLFGVFLPGGLSLIVWSIQNVMSTSAASSVFWEALVVALFFAAQFLWPPLHWAIGQIRRPSRPGGPALEGVR